MIALSPLQADQSALVEWCQECLVLPASIQANARHKHTLAERLALWCYKNEVRMSRITGVHTIQTCLLISSDFTDIGNCVNLLA